MKEILIMNRTKAKSLSYSLANKETNKKYAIISISEMIDKSPFFERSTALVDVLKLHFDDVENNETGYYAITDEDAKRIANFVKNIDDKIDILIVHCLAGRSRSAGVAGAISKWKFNDDSYFFKNYTPNMLCYRKVLDCLMTEK